MRSAIQKRIPYFLLVGVAIAGLLTLSACGGNGSLSVTISPSTASVPINGVLTGFTATVNNATSTTNTSVTWEVNGVSGGNSATGTITALGTDNLQATFTGPGAVPSTDNGQVSITAVLQSNTNVISNTATVTITAGTGVQVTPSTALVSAGGNQPFAATYNGEPDTNVTWTITPTGVGSIDEDGNYTAPLYPPPGGSVTVTATDNTITTDNVGTATASIQYSALSFNGPFAFSYSGNNAAGFFSVAGSFLASGNGAIQDGVADIVDLKGSTTAAQIMNTSTYTVSSSGALTLLLKTSNGGSYTLQGVMTTNLHGTLIAYDNNTVGSGTIDQQSANDLNIRTPGVIEGPYVFSLSGVDSAFKPLAIAGRFTANGLGGIPNVFAIVDTNDAGVVNGDVADDDGPTFPDTTLSGNYQLDSNNLGTGRGTMTLSSTNINAIMGGHVPTFDFYFVDSTHVHLVETDGFAFLSGDLYTGLNAPGGFTLANLTAGKYSYNFGGTSLSGTTASAAFAAGGVFVSNGTGDLTSGGALDLNDGGNNSQVNTPLVQCAYTVDSNTGRLNFFFVVGNNSCVATTNSNTIFEFSGYQTAQGSAVMMELDNNRVTTGLAYLQTITAGTLDGNYALQLGGTGAFHNTPGQNQPDAIGSVEFTGGVLSGTLAINNYGNILQPSTLNTTSVLSAPDANGRGTMTIYLANGATFKLVYYQIDLNDDLLLDVDQSRVATGQANLQF
ncbi:MAG: hypothetical protein WA875_03775 [Candidatus Acidiferrales bacterium]